MIQLDVGQGDAALVLGAKSAGMIDTGAVWAMGPHRWIELVATYGVNRLDWVAISHLDADHVGSLPLRQ